MNPDLTWDTSGEPCPADVAVVDAGLDAFNRQAADFTTIRRLACFARSPAGDVIGGAVGRYWSHEVHHDTRTR